MKKQVFTALALATMIGAASTGAYALTVSGASDTTNEATPILDAETGSSGATGGPAIEYVGAGHDAVIDAETSASSGGSASATSGGGDGLVILAPNSAGSASAAMPAATGVIKEKATFLARAQAYLKTTFQGVVDLLP